MTQDCGNPNCKDCHPPIGTQRAAPRSMAAVKAEATVLALSLLAPVDGSILLRRITLPKSGNHFTPCDKCSKPTRGARCFKCRTQGADR